MNRKLLTRTLGLVALTMLAASGFVQTSSAAPSEMSAAAHRKTAGLTEHGIANARASGAPSRLVAMQPQSSVALLEQQATELGPHAANSNLSLTIGLKLRHVAKLKSFLQQVQSPASPIYHHFLTPEQFTAEYGPSKANVASVAQFLEQHGIKVKDVSADRMLIHTEATTKVYSHAFGIEINDYGLSGRRFFSTTDRPKLPRSIAPLVTNIIGLNRAVKMESFHHYEPLTSALLQGTSPYTSPPPPTTSAHYNPYQIATAYDWPDITDSKNGAGATIAILTAAASGLDSNSNYRAFWSAYGLPDHDVDVIPVDGDVGDTQGMVETLLDVEWSGAMAPGASLDVYVASSTALISFTDMYDKFVDDNDAQVMTVSWGSNENLAPALYKTDEQIFMKAAAQGISMFAATGDKGSGSGSGQANMANYPSSSVYITSANGTVLRAKKDGSYISETAWSGTGGAVSELFDQPDWQTGPGVPDSGWRMNSDISMNAGSAHPYLLREQGRWATISGTSAVSPQLAALFAVAVSEQSDGNPLGQSNRLIYNEVNGGYYALAFHDVTSGCNGAYCAKAEWDHPTGWGSPRGSKLIAHLGAHGPTGTLTGTVSDDASGAAIADATVKVTTASGSGAREQKTLSNGSYSFLLPVGSYTVSVSSFDYKTKTASVSISQDTTTTQDVSLRAAPSAVLSGRITDDSGHGYGLYGEIKVNTAGFGEVKDVWTDPASGKYSVSLPMGSEYSLQVNAAFDGYSSSSATIKLTANQVENFSLDVSAVCTAPGYSFKSGGLSEDFNGSFPPAGWTVGNAVTGSSVVWKSNEAWDDDNWTGGTGGAADSDSGKAGPAYQGPHDTSLVSPPIAVASLPANPFLQYKVNFQSFQDRDALNLDISTDGGATWRTILHWNGNHGGNEALPGKSVRIQLGPYLPSTGNFQLRWRNYDLSSNAWDYYAQIDDVSIGTCAPVRGGLIYGRVTDGNTNDGVIGARVEDDHNQGANTVKNPSDPAWLPGTYLFFAGSGKRSLTATAYNYYPATDTVKVTPNTVVTQNFTLNAGQFSANPGQLNLHVPVNGQSEQTITVKNIGSEKAHFLLLPIDMAAPMASAASASASALAVKGHFTPANMPYVQAHGKTRNATLPAASVGFYASPWSDIAPYPTAIEDSAVARDPASGKLYSLGGFNGNVNTNMSFIYEPKLNGWAFMGFMPAGRAAAAAAFINGKLYVVNGWNSFNGEAVSALGIYNPADGSWKNGAENPVPAAGGSAVAVLDGKMYVVGGCKAGSCDVRLAAVQVYDPATNRWTSAMDYPHLVAFASCGVIVGRLYCAAGSDNGSKQYSDGYAYDPNTNTWMPIAPMPFGLWGGGYAAANGELLISGGITNDNSTMTTKGLAYNPFSNKWHHLPSSDHLVYRSGSACGFYKIGGKTASGALVSSGEWLPGYEPCSTLASIPWLTLAPTSRTLAAGASAEIKLEFDGTGEKPFTTSQAYIEVAGYTPYDTVMIPLTVTWDPESVSLVLSGSAGQDSVSRGGSLLYTLTVENQQGKGFGTATETTLTYNLPTGASYIASNGDAVCTAPPASASPASSAVSCDFGKLEPGANKTVTIVVQANVVGKLTSTFKVSAREPNDSENNTLTLKTTVTGTGSGGGGGGAIGWLALVMLFGLGFAGICVRFRHGRKA